MLRLLYSHPASEETETERLADQAIHMEEEARVISPGIQALVGFQLIAVFHQRFEALSPFEQRFLLAAIFFTALSIAFVLAPAAYHRQAEPGGISGFFCLLGSLALSIALLSLMLGLSADLYVITVLVTRSPKLSIWLAAGMLLVYAICWFVFLRAAGMLKRKQYGIASMARHSAR